jgi:hypothetical protein
MELGSEWKGRGLPKFEWFPDFLDKYMKYTENTEPSYIHNLFCGLGIASVAMGGACRINYGAMKPVPANLFIGIIAPSGFRKTESLRLAMRIYNSAIYRTEMLKEPVPDIASNVGLLKHANEEHRVVNVMKGDEEISYTPMFIPSSEFAAFIRSRDKDMVTMLTNLFDGAVITENFSYKTITGGDYSIVRPYPVLMVCTTPEWLTARLPSGARQGGFLSRFLFAYSEKFKVKSFPQSSPDIAKKAEDAIDSFVKMAERVHDINWTPEAKEAFAHWYESTGGGMMEAHDPEMRSWISRQGIFVIKISGISAKADHRIRIEKKDLDFAWTLLYFARESVKITFRLTGENIDAWMELQIVKYILDEGNAEEIPSLPCSKICRRFSADVSAYKIRQIIESLHSMGVLILDKRNDRVVARMPQARDYVQESIKLSL